MEGKKRKLGEENKRGGCGNIGVERGLGGYIIMKPTTCVCFLFVLCDFQWLWILALKVFRVEREKDRQRAREK